MKELLRKGRDKWTKPLICLIVPLTVLPFFWTTDSMPGKILLIAKFALTALLWLLHAELISLPENIGLGLVACSMAVTVRRKGGAGIALLFMIMFFCLITFPKIKLSIVFRRWLFLALGITIFGCALFGILMNVSTGLAAFDITGLLYPNTSGLLFVGSCLFIQCVLSNIEQNSKRWICCGISSILFLVVIVLTGCRSAMLALFAFALLQIIFSVWNKERLYSFFHIAIIICTVLICCVYLYLMFENLAVHDELSEVPVLGKNFFTGREAVWRDALEYAKTSPVLGCGNQYLLAWNQYSSAHNVPIGIFYCMGLLPTLFYFFLQFRPGKLYSLKDNTTIQQRIPAVCFMAAMTITAFECSLTDAQLNFLFLPLLLGYAPEPVKSEEVSHD